MQKRRRIALLCVADMLQHFMATAIITLAIFGAVMCITGCTEKADAAVVLPDETPVTVLTQQEEQREYVYATFDVPLDYDLQVHIIQTCEELNIDAAVVMAMIFFESSYDATSIGDSGESFGLMQVQPRWNSERIEMLGVTDILDPYQNVSVGIDLLAELLEKHDGNTEKALIEYNAGAPNAYKYWFSQGEYSNEYSQKVTDLARLLNGGGTVG